MSRLMQAATELRQARQRLETAKHRAAEAAEDAHNGDMTETDIARELGVNRLTVRKWLGK